ncbi:MAG: amidohydrolase family protein, partial [Longimicrobiales bacterium]|nr:amidohydrolase family protein [Longimicrobiales bacterium]
MNLRSTAHAMLLLVTTVFWGCGSGGEVAPELTAEIVYRNGSILTLDAAATVARDLAIRDGKVIAVGDWTDDQTAAYIGPDTEVLDLEGRTVIPGLQDSHLHFIGLGADDYYVVRFDDATSIPEIQALLRARLEQLEAEGQLDVWTYPTTGETGPWLFGAGWNQAKLEEGRMADRHDLDEVSREVPITLDRVYRGVAVNTRVFELQGYDFDRPETWPAWFTEDPASFGPGDIIVRNPETGLPTGVFYGFAPALIGEAPARSFEQRVESVGMGARTVLSKGIVAVVDPGIQEDNRVYQEAYNR